MNECHLISHHWSNNDLVGTHRCKTWKFKCTHHFECDALKVAAIQTYELISVVMGFIASTTFKQVFFALVKS